MARTDAGLSNGSPRRAPRGWRRLLVSLQAICVCLLLISAIVRFAVFT